MEDKKIGEKEGPQERPIVQQRCKCWDNPCGPDLCDGYDISCPKYREVMSQLTEREIQVALMCIDISFPSDVKDAMWNRFDVNMTKPEIHQVQLIIDEKLRYQLEDIQNVRR